MRKFVWLAFGAALAPAVRADFLYTFNRTLGGGFLSGPASFVLDTPASVTTNTTFIPGVSLTCLGCTALVFYIDAVAQGFTTSPSSAILYGVNPTGFPIGGELFYFPAGAFAAPGTYTSLFFGGSDTLDVEALPTVPEPSSIFLLGTIASAFLLTRLLYVCAYKRHLPSAKLFPLRPQRAELQELPARILLNLTSTEESRKAVPISRERC
jgi:hypothetical protein